MVIEGDLGLDAVVYAVTGILIATLGAALFIAAVCSRVGRHRFGLASAFMSWVLVVGLTVLAVVLWRTKEGEATFYDWVWAVGLGIVGLLFCMRLLRRRRS